MKFDVFYDILQATPIISAAKTMDGLEKSISQDGGIVFILFGDILNIAGIISRVKSAGKLAFVHADLIDGLSPRDIAVDFLAKSTDADGIISTKANLIRRAKSFGLLTIQRFFVLDSIALINIEKQLPFDGTDAIEILPGAIPKVIKKIAKLTQKPIIAGGLIYDKEDVMNALGAGALAVSSSNAEIWHL